VRATSRSVNVGRARRAAAAISSWTECPDSTTGQAPAVEAGRMMSTSGSVCRACVSIIARAGTCEDSFAPVMRESECDEGLLKDERITVYATRPTTTAVAAAASRGQRRRHRAAERDHGLGPDLRPSSRTSSSSAGEFGASAHSTPSRTRQAFLRGTHSATCAHPTPPAARDFR
jgi:hypothetical protein